LVTITLAHLLQAELIDKVLYTLALILLRIVCHLQHCADVILYREVAENRCLLSQVSYAHLSAAVYRKGCDVGNYALVVFEEYTSFVWLYKTYYHIKGCGLAGAVRAKQTYDLSLINIYRDVVHDSA
jgi:hypothetical protein